MSVIGWQYSCLDCGGDIALVNEGANHGHAAFAVYACTTCHEEWVPRIIVARLHGLGATAGQRRSTTLVASRAAEAHQLIQGGHSVRDACLTVGIDRRSYYDRQTGRKR